MHYIIGAFDAVDFVRLRLSLEISNEHTIKVEDRAKSGFWRYLPRVTAKMHDINKACRSHSTYFEHVLSEAGFSKASCSLSLRNLSISLLENTLKNHHDVCAFRRL